MTELSGALYAAIEQLSERDQKIVVLYSRGYTEREIAIVVGGCQKSIHNWKKSILAKLRVCLKDYC